MNILGGTLLCKQWVSRAKTLLKRRKYAVKHRPISTKRLKEEAHLFNYAKEYRSLQIQKELDRKTYASQHINELMDEIFYPDVTQVHEEAAKIHLETSTLREYSHDLENADDFEEGIYELVLASEILQFYLSNQDIVEIHHIEIALTKLASYFKNYESIKQTTFQKWQKTQEIQKKHNKNYVEKKCPYLFIDKEDTFHYKPWNEFIEHINMKLQEYFQEEESKADVLIAFSGILIQFDSAVGYVPYASYALFSNWVSDLEIDAPIAETSVLLSAIALKDKVRLPAYYAIEEESTTINASTQYLLNSLLSKPDIEPEHFESCVKILSQNSLLFTSQIWALFESSLLSLLPQLPFEEVVKCLSIYLVNKNTKNFEIIELIKFDILRKCDNVTEIESAFKCLAMIKKGYFIEGNDEKLEITSHPAMELFHTLSTLICSKLCGKNILSHSQIITLSNSYLENNLTDMNLLELLSTEIVKNKASFTLQECTMLVWNMAVLGYKSPVLAKILFVEFTNRYQDSKLAASKEQSHFLPIHSLNPNPTATLQPTISLQQLQLEEDLIICLYLLLNPSNSNNKLVVSVDSLMSIYPLKISSTHPLIYELITNLNAFTRQNNLLWSIKHQQPNNPIFNSDRFHKYYSLPPRNIAQELMQLEANESEIFIGNYCKENDKFVESSWLWAGDEKCKKYYEVEEYGEWLVDNKSNNRNYFNDKKSVSSKICELRIKFLEQLTNKQSVIKKRQQIEQSEETYYKLD